MAATEQEYENLKNNMGMLFNSIMEYDIADLPDLDAPEEVKLSHNMGFVEQPTIEVFGGLSEKDIKGVKGTLFSGIMEYNIDDLPDLDAPEEVRQVHKFGEIIQPTIEDFGAPTQLLRVWNLPPNYDTKDVFTFLGSTYDIHKERQKFLILTVPKSEAENLVKTKNSTIFQNQFIGLRFEDPAQRKVKA